MLKKLKRFIYYLIFTWEIKYNKLLVKKNSVTLTQRKFVVRISMPSFCIASFSASRYCFGSFLISKRLKIGREIRTSLEPEILNDWVTDQFAIIILLYC